MLRFGTARRGTNSCRPLIKVGNVTVHQVVEQEGPFFDVLPFFPTLNCLRRTARGCSRSS
jgi:hypothetical protein